jgi:pimeloyl-ACP methyl ester carboxylesterase
MLFMIHGMWVTSDMWGNYRDFFELRGYPTKAPTLLHHRKFPYPEELKDTHIMDYVQQCVKEIEDMEAKPIILGHSLGGLIGQKLAELGLAQTLVLIAPAPPRGISPLSRSVLWTYIRSIPKIILGEPFKLPLSKARYGVMNSLSVEEQDRLYSQFVYESAWAPREIVMGSISVDASKITCPVLVIAGVQDRAIPIKIAKKIAGKYHASYIEYPGYCHCGLIHGPGWQKVAQGITSWIENE